MSWAPAGHATMDVFSAVLYRGPLQPAGAPSACREAAFYAGATVAWSISSAWGAAKQALPQPDIRGFKLLSSRLTQGGATGAGVRRVGSGAPRALPRRKLPGFLPQFWWCLGTAVLKRSREPLAVFTDHAIFALTGAHGVESCCRELPEPPAPATVNLLAACCVAASRHDAWPHLRPRQGDNHA